MAGWGGRGALSATGAFAEVSELPDASLWLRATPTISEFTGDRIGAVFEALAPVLVTGRTRFMFGHKQHRPRLVEGVDAADYQSPATTPPRPLTVPPPGQETTLRQMNAALWTDRTDSGMADAARGWMLGVLEVLIPDLLAATSTRPATSGMPAGDPLGWPLDGPDTLNGVLRIGDRHARQVRYSRAGWRRLLTALNRTMQHAEIEIFVVGEDGLGRGWGYVAIQRRPDEDSWTRLPSARLRSRRTGPSHMRCRTGGPSLSGSRQCSRTPAVAASPTPEHPAKG